MGKLPNQKVKAELESFINAINLKNITNITDLSLKNSYNVGIIIGIYRYLKNI